MIQIPPKPLKWPNTSRFQTSKLTKIPLKCLEWPDYPKNLQNDQNTLKCVEWIPKMTLEPPTCPLFFVCARAYWRYLHVCMCVLKTSTQGKVQLQTLLQKRKEKMISKNSIFQLHLTSNIYSSHVYYWVFITDYHWISFHL